MARLETRSKDGTRLAIHDLGGNGRPALIVHGVGLNGRVFTPLAGALADTYHCYAIDLRAHGASAVPDPLDLAWTRLSDDVAAGVEVIATSASAGQGAPVGIAHSAGGTAALMLEALHRGTFSSLYCYEPVVATPDERGEITPTHPIVTQALRRKARFSSRQEAFERYRSRAPFDTITTEALCAYVEFGLVETERGFVELVCRPEYEAALYLASEGSDLYEVAPRITCPVTVASGSAENGIGPVLARAAARRIGGARLVHFPGLGHLGPLEDPDMVAASIIEATDSAPA